MPETSGDIHPHFRALDGLRGLAFIAVFYAHVDGYQRQRLALGAITRLHLPRAGFGNTGVDLFFVLSGFLITGILMRARASENYYSTFYLRRVLRLAPVYYIAVGLTFGLHWIWQGARAYPMSVQIWYWLDFSNFYSIFFAKFHPTVPLGHFWTLAIEEQFYLVWPWLVLRLKNRALLLLSITMIAAELLLRVTPLFRAWDARFEGALAYCFTLAHSEGLFCGAAVAILIYEGYVRVDHVPALRRWTIGWLVLSFLVFFYAPSSFHPCLYTATGIGYGCLLALLVLQHGAGSTSRLLSSRPLRLLGRYSYCMYVVHVPLLYLGWRYVFHRMPNKISIVCAYLLLLASCIAIAAVSWHLVEGPMQTMKRHFLYRNKKETQHA